MLNLRDMAKDPKKDAPEMPEMDLFFEALEKKLKDIPQAEIEKGAQKIQDFLDGKIGWGDVFNFTPEQIEQMAEMGYTQFKQGRYHDAEKFFKVLTILDWENFYYHSMMGSILQRQKRDGEAIVEYSQAIESNANDVVSLTNRGEIFMKHGWLQDAIRDFKKVISLDPKGENRWATRARVLLAQIEKSKKPAEK